jgi:hypothetical protein
MPSRGFTMASGLGEDKASWRHDLSAFPGTKIEEGRQEAALCFTFGIGIKALNRSCSFFSQPLANAANRKLHFTLNHYKPCSH